jgi:hypothetical protein
MNNDVLDALTLWEFPPEDFSRWRREFSDVVDSYEEYQMWLTGMERQAEQRGARAVRVQLTIEEMLAELAAVGAQNTSENRAAIIGLIAACRRMRGISK